jgi:holo-[acyl-carrier protein] synthase
MRPLRAFPFPVNIGTDVCQISRIYAILSGPRATRFVHRVLAPEEQHHAAPRLASLSPKTTTTRQLRGHVSDAGVKGEGQPQRDPELWKTAAFVAGRFAAKEAAIKAHSHRRLTFHDIIIERRGRDEERLGSGPPVARIKAQRDEDDDGHDMSAMISISHDGDYATAVCLGYDPSVTQQGVC